jgi:hypothetical protein
MEVEKMTYAVLSAMALAGWFMVVLEKLEGFK